MSKPIYNKKQLAFFRKEGSKGGRKWWESLTEEEKQAHVDNLTRKSVEARARKKALKEDKKPGA